VTKKRPAQLTVSWIPPEPGGIEWINDPVSDDVDGEGKSRSDGEENEGAVDDRARATVVNPACVDSRTFEHAIDACFDRAGQNPTVPDQYSPFPRLRQDVGEPRIGLVFAEEGAGACSASARMLCGKRQIGRAGRSSRAVHL
jgi:hypothetical protein